VRHQVSNLLSAHPGLSQRKIRPDVRAAPAARRADETRLKVGQPDVVRTRVGVDRDVMAAMKIRAIDQQTANIAMGLGA
jgi:hypothetical protein